ncbi:hypothetical protein C0991_012147, partial [Blastosporella zonata]
LKFLFASCGVTKNAKKKALGICYVDYNTSEQWLLISEYQPYDDSQPALPYSYDDWKRAIISLYPGTDAATKYRIADLDQIMGKAARTNIKTIGQFTDYYRKFYQVSKWLTNSGQIGSLKRALQAAPSRDLGSPKWPGPAQMGSHLSQWARPGLSGLAQVTLGPPKSQWAHPSLNGPAHVLMGPPNSQWAHPSHNGPAQVLMGLPMS